MLDFRQFLERHHGLPQLPELAVIDFYADAAAFQPQRQLGEQLLLPWSAITLKQTIVQCEILLETLVKALDIVIYLLYGGLGGMHIYSPSSILLTASSQQQCRRQSTLPGSKSG